MKKQEPPKEEILTEDAAQLRQEIADLVGIDQSQVRTFAYELAVLRNRGLLVALNIQGTGMFERKADFDEYGVSKGDIRQDRLKTGRKLILPVDDDVKVFKSIASTIRNLLIKYSNKLPGFYPYHYVPFPAFQSKFKPKFLECQILWQAQIERVIDNLDGYRDQISALAAQEAEQSWRAMDYSFTLNGEKMDDFEDYVDYCVNRDTADIPTEEEIREKLNLDYYVAMVYGAADMAADRLKAVLLDQQVRIEQERESITIQTMNEEARSQAERNYIEEETLRQKREAILTAEAEHVRKQLAENGSPFDQIIRDMRDRAAKSAAEMLISIKQNGFLHTKIADKGKGLKEYFELMATHDDTYLMDLLTHLDKKIGEVSRVQGKRDNSEIIKTLEEIEALSKREFKALMNDKGYFAAIEVE